MASVFAASPAAFAHNNNGKNKLSDKTCQKIEQTFNIIRHVNREGDLSNSDEQKASDLVSYFGKLCENMEQFELG